jgi:hypothetical protein
MKTPSLIVVVLFVFLHSSTQQVVPLGLHGSPEYVDFVISPRWQGVGSASLTLDQQGWPQNDFEWILDYRRNKPWNGPDFAGMNDNVAGNYQLSFLGEATLSAADSDTPTAATFVNQTYDPSTHITNATLVIHPGHFLFILTFTSTRRPGLGNNTGLTNIHLYQPGYSLDKPQLFTNRFLSVVSGLKSATFRSFDTGINSYNIWYGTDLINNSWAERSLPTDAYWPLNSRNVGNVSGLGMPWEIFMQICLQTNTPGWFNLPVGADDDYVMNFALLLKNGNQYTKPLNPDLPFYIEYSNEVWNWGFSQSIYNEVKAKANNITNLQNYVQRVFQISKIFRKVFGDAAMGTTVRMLCMWQYGTWNDVFAALLWGQSTFGGNVKDYVWGIGEAPYVDPLETGHVPYGLLDPAGVDRIIDSFYTSAGQRRQAFTAWQAVATYLGIHVTGYESGPSLNAGIEGEASRSMRLKDFEYRYYMENYFATGAAAANYFALGPGQPDPFGDWYLFEHWGQYDVGRYEGYMAVSGQQYPALSVGFVLPWNQGDSITIDASQMTTAYAPGSRAVLCPTWCWPYPPIFTYLLRATTTGQFQITLSGTGQANSNFALWLDNQLIKSGLSLPSSGNGDISVPFQISSQGLHAIGLIGGQGQTVFSQGGGIVITLTSGKGTPTVPSAPLNVLVRSTSPGVVLEWELVPTATSYTIQRSTVSGGPYSAIETTANTSFVDSKVTNAMMYYYVVTAQNSVGSSALSPQVQIIPVAGAIPPAPSVTVTSGMQNGGSPVGSLGQAYLTWAPLPTAQSYTIVRISGTTKTTLSQNQLAPLIFDAGLTPGSTYTYTVTATNGMGTGPAAQVSTTIPKSSAPGAPTSLNASLSGGLAYLKWNQALWSYPEFAELFLVEKAASSNGPWSTLVSISTSNAIDYSPGTHACYRVWGSSSYGGNSPQPSNTACF